MRSRWLDWPQRSQEIETRCQNEATKPTKPGFGSFVSVRSGAKTVASERTDELPVADPYAERMRVALSKINQQDYPAGMIRWLDTAQPVLYAELTSRLPDEIHRLWAERAPLEHFEAVLTRLVSLHEKCCGIYRAAQKDPTSVPKNIAIRFWSA